MAIGPLDVSKIIGYSVLSPPDALDASKLVGYAVLSTEVNVAASKIVGYAVLEDYVPSESMLAPCVFVVT